MFIRKEDAPYRRRPACLVSRTHALFAGEAVAGGTPTVRGRRNPICQKTGARCTPARGNLLDRPSRGDAKRRQMFMSSGALDRLRRWFAVESGSFPHRRPQAILLSTANRRRRNAVVGQEPPLRYTQVIVQLHRCVAVVGQEPPLRYTRNTSQRSSILAVVGPEPPLRYTAGRYQRPDRGAVVGPEPPLRYTI